MNKLFAFDMDGTILNSQEGVQPKTIEALKELHKNGHDAIIATGRPFIDAIRDLGEAKQYIKYIVCNNGSYYGTLDEKEFKYFGQVPEEILDDVLKIGQEHNCFFAIHGSKEAMRSYLGSEEDKSFNWESKDFEEFAKFKDNFVDVDFLKKWIKGQNISQMSLRSDEPTILKIKNIFSKYRDIVDIHIVNDVYLDLNPKGISKILGIKKVADVLGYKLDDVIAFGDSGNDLQMLKESGLGICMGNGNDKAKAAADIVIGSNDTNAIRDKILEILNEK